MTIQESTGVDVAEPYHAFLQPEESPAQSQRGGKNPMRSQTRGNALTAPSEEIPFLSVDGPVPRVQSRRGGLSVLARRDFWLERVPETFLRHKLRWVAGLIFLVFGLMKVFPSTLPLLLGAPDLQVTTGAEGFARVLTELGVPFPTLNAWVVTVLETLCGLGLILGAWTRGTRLVTCLSALPMVGDMTVALLVGVRQVSGHPIVLDGFAVMNQPWRLPLELGLLLGMIYLVWRPAARPWAVPSQ